MNGKFTAAHFHIDYRTEKRRVWARPAEIMVAGQPTRKAKTCDISCSGISVLTDAPFPRGVECTVVIAFFLNEDYLQLKASGVSIYSTLVSTEGFRTGIYYRQLDDTTRMLIARVVGP